mmetsp:Transcript_88377/g.143050  ORF Transcript_88377/g.143050 Transcript_88377/m.143050 type:complete len:115 (-) Transcript_88377:168-512(-)
MHTHASKCTHTARSMAPGSLPASHMADVYACETTFLQVPRVDVAHIPSVSLTVCTKNPRQEEMRIKKIPTSRISNFLCNLHVFRKTNENSVCSVAVAMFHRDFFRECLVFDSCV